MVLFVLVAILAPWIAPHSPTEIQLSESLRPPAWQNEGSSAHLLGTDKLGRDILSRIMYGARISLLVAVTAIGAGGAVGIALGMLAAYGPIWVTTLVMRLVDVMLSTPTILLALLFTVVFEASFYNLITVIVLTLWAGYARQAYAQTLSLKERDFVLAARAIGASNLRIVSRHIFPNLLNTMVILATLNVSTVILIEAALSFLGLGIPPPTPSWGRMISEGRILLRTAWWVTTMPGIALSLVVLSGNLAGDWLRDYLDPTLRHVQR
jgi:peptide/nickel transport system permease protein